MLKLAAGGRTHADWHQAVVGLGDRRRGERQLNDDQRPQGFHEAVLARQVTASLRLIRKLLSNHDDLAEHCAAHLKYAYAPVRLALDELLLPDGSNRASYLRRTRSARQSEHRQPPTANMNSTTSATPACWPRRRLISKQSLVRRRPGGVAWPIRRRCSRRWAVGGGIGSMQPRPRHRTLTRQLTSQREQNLPHKPAHRCRSAGTRRPAPCGGNGP